MKVRGHLQVIGNIEAQNLPSDTADFYGITIKQSSDAVAFRGINTVAFNSNSFYVTQNVPNTDEVIVNFRGSAGSSGVTDHGLLGGLADNDHPQYAFSDKSNPSPWVAASDLSGRNLSDLGTRAHVSLTSLSADDHTQYALADKSRPTLWNVRVTDGSNIQDDDTINFNKNDFYVSANLSGQPVVNFLNKSACLLTTSAAQTTNLLVNDHIKFNSIQFLIGSNIVPDITTAYSNSNSVASIGRITLQPHKIYAIEASLRPQFSGATGAVSMVVANDTGVQQGIASRQIAVTATAGAGGGDSANRDTAVAIVTPTVATRYEFRISSIDAIGTAGLQLPHIKIVEL